MANCQFNIRHSILNIKINSVFIVLVAVNVNIFQMINVVYGDYKKFKKCKLLKFNGRAISLP